MFLYLGPSHSRSPLYIWRPSRLQFFAVFTILLGFKFLHDQTPIQECSKTLSNCTTSFPPQFFLKRPRVEFHVIHLASPIQMLPWPPLLVVLGADLAHRILNSCLTAHSGCSVTVHTYVVHKPVPFQSEL